MTGNQAMRTQAGPIEARPRFDSWEAAVRWIREQPGQCELIRDAFYDDPLLAAAERYHRGTEWQDIRLLLRGRHGTALDVGAGRGIASYALAREGFAVTSLEPDPSDLVGAGAIRALARESGLLIGVVEDFSERLPFDDSTFDVVFARAVMHHTRDLNSACAEFQRVLKPGGLFLGVREHVISRHEDLPAFLAAHPMHDLYGGENAFLLDEYLTALRNARLTVERVLEPLGSPINYFPQTEDSLRDQIAAHAGRIPGLRTIVGALLRPRPFFNAAIGVLTRFDSRPGRLYSFVCTKPEAR